MGVIMSSVFSMTGDLKFEIRIRNVGQDGFVQYEVTTEPKKPEVEEVILRKLVGVRILSQTLPEEVATFIATFEDGRFVVRHKMIEDLQGHFTQWLYDLIGQGFSGILTLRRKIEGICEKLLPKVVEEAFDTFINQPELLGTTTVKVVPGSDSQLAGRQFEHFSMRSAGGDGTWQDVVFMKDSTKRSMILHLASEDKAAVEAYLTERFNALLRERLAEELSESLRTNVTELGNLLGLAEKLGQQGVTVNLPDGSDALKTTVKALLASFVNEDDGKGERTETDGEPFPTDEDPEVEATGDGTTTPMTGEEAMQAAISLVQLGTPPEELPGAPSQSVED